MAHYRIHEALHDKLPGKCPHDDRDLVTVEGPTYHENALVGQIEYRSFRRKCPKCTFKTGLTMLRSDVATELEKAPDHLSIEPFTFREKFFNFFFGDKYE